MSGDEHTSHEAGYKANCFPIFNSVTDFSLLCVDKCMTIYLRVEGLSSEAIVDPLVSTRMEGYAWDHIQFPMMIKSVINGKRFLAPHYQMVLASEPGPSGDT